MNKFVYSTSGGKHLLMDKFTPEEKAIILRILKHLDEIGMEGLFTKPIDTKNKPPIYEIRKGGVRVFYAMVSGDLYIAYIQGHKQKNETTKVIKDTVKERIQSMINNSLNRVLL